jgi:hypothetical protein
VPRCCEQFCTSVTIRVTTAKNAERIIVKPCQIWSPLIVVINRYTRPAIPLLT